MLNVFKGDEPWFRAKRYGYGAGLPMAWQGWVLTAAHLAAIAVVAYALKDSLFAMVPLLMIVTFAPLSIYKGRTEGGWKWRNGDALD
jgi:hypothetical protein